MRPEYRSAWDRAAEEWEREALAPNAPWVARETPAVHPKDEPVILPPPSRG